MRRFTIILLIMAALAAWGCSRQEPVIESAALILTGASIPKGLAAPGASAVAVVDGRIAYVGSDQGAREQAGPGAEVIDLKGATLIPGFIDSHCHLYGLGTALAQIDLVGTATVDEALERIAAADAAALGDDWLLGRGWDQNDWPVQEYPNRGQLDGVTGDRPALLRRIDGHAAWANSAALLAAGITAETPNPEGGSILRGADGEPTGVLIDNAVDLVSAVAPPASAQEKRRRIDLAVAECLKYGLTGVHEAGVDLELAGIYRAMADAGELPLRIYAMYDDKPEVLAHAAAEGPYFHPGGMLTIRAVKLYADGALGSRGALLLDDYTDAPGARGLAVTPRDHLLEVCRDLGGQGFQICTHAIGDGGNRLVLDVYADILGDLGGDDRRWRVEHAQILAVDDIPRFGKLGVIAAMQPTHCTSDMDWADERLGDERLLGAYAWRSLLDTGAHLCLGTDFPIEAVDPLWGLYAARTRTHHDGTPPGGWMPLEKLDAATALELYTAGSAFAAFAEDRLGRIEPGYLADFTVLDGDPVAAEPAALLSMRTVMTVVDGKIVYQKGR